MDSSTTLRGILLGDTVRGLARLGQEIEQALAALPHVPEEARVDAEYSCADKVWRYFVQREALGLTSHEQVIETYAIPARVLAKVGAQRPLAPRAHAGPATEPHRDHPPPP